MAYESVRPYGKLVTWDDGLDFSEHIYGIGKHGKLGVLVEATELVEPLDSIMDKCIGP